MAEIVFKNYTGQPLQSNQGVFLVEGTAAVRDYKRLTQIGMDDETCLLIYTPHDNQIGLPAQEQNVFLIVSADVALAAKMSGRTTADLLVPMMSHEDDARCVALIAYDEEGHYCNCSDHCNDKCKYGRKNCFGQGENVHFKIKEEVEKSHFVIKGSNT